MNKQLSLGLILLVLLIASCTPPVVFDQPQPIDGQDVTVIPVEYQGLYVCESDSTLIIISDHIVYAQHEHFFVISIEGLEEREDCSLIENEIYLTGKDMCIPIKYIDENTVKGYITDIDTLFIMNDLHAAKTYKGHLFLSNKMDNAGWAVSMLSLDDGGNILYRGITEDSDMRGINRITPMVDITKPTDRNRRFKISPDQAAFDQLMKDNDIFIDCEYLMKVNLEIDHIEAF